MKFEAPVSISTDVMNSLIGMTVEDARNKIKSLISTNTLIEETKNLKMYNNPDPLKLPVTIATVIDRYDKTTQKYTVNIYLYVITDVDDCSIVTVTPNEDTNITKICTNSIETKGHYPDANDKASLFLQGNISEDKCKSFIGKTIGAIIEADLKKDNITIREYPDGIDEKQIINSYVLRNFGFNKSKDISLCKLEAITDASCMAVRSYTAYNAAIRNSKVTPCAEDRIKNLLN